MVNKLVMYFVLLILGAYYFLIFPRTVKQFASKDNLETFQKQ